MSDLATEVTDPVYGSCNKDKGYDKPKSTSARFAISTQPVDEGDAAHKDASPYARPELPCVDKPIDYGTVWSLSVCRQMIEWI